MPQGFSAPYSPTGRSAIVPAPPWYYAGWILSVEYEVGEAAAAYLPPELGRPTGRAALHVADWQSTTDGSELLDPIYSQYRELFIVLEVERDGDHVNFCPFIYVDQDVSLIRGWLQGLPKKFASIWLTRSLPLDHPAAAPARAGTRLGASLAVKDRRLVDVAMTLSGTEGERIGFLRQPTYTLLGLPSLLGGPNSATPRLVRMAAESVVHGPSYAAEASFEVFESSRDELIDLAPLRILAASAGYAGLTISSIAEVS